MSQRIRSARALPGATVSFNLRQLAPYEYICKIWTSKPDRFKFDPFQHTVGLNT
ncbi:MAG: hypothetical protein WC701_08240 [Kiritimatiellales bacterium]|jgi:hypothetical protein